MQTEQPLNEPENASFLKPKTRAKRNLTDEQRTILAERMRAINDKRIADAMAKKNNLPSAKVAEPLPPPITPKPTKRKVIKVVEVSEDEDGEEESESEDEVEIVIVPKKKTPKPKAEAKPKTKPKAKKQPVYEEEEEEEEPPKSILKPRGRAKSQQMEPVQEQPRILYRFL